MRQWLPIFGLLATCPHISLILLFLSNPILLASISRINLTSSHHLIHSSCFGPLSFLVWINKIASISHFSFPVVMAFPSCPHWSPTVNFEVFISSYHSFLKAMVSTVLNKLQIPYHKEWSLTRSYTFLPLGANFIAPTLPLSLCSSFLFLSISILVFSKILHLLFSPPAEILLQIFHSWFLTEVLSQSYLLIEVFPHHLI